MSEWNIQKAIFDALDGVISVAVLDFAEQDTAYPYVSIGESTFLPWDTDTETGLEGTITIHTWTRGRGRKANKDIQREIYNALHRASLTVAGGDAVGIDFEFSDTVRDADGFTVHGVQRFRLLFDQG